MQPHTSQSHPSQSIQSEGFLSSRPNWVHPPPPSLRVLPPPQGPRGETHSLVGEGVGGHSSDEGTDTLVLRCTIIPLRHPSPIYCICVFFYFFGGLECVGHSFAYVARLWFLRDVWIRTQSAAVASWRATDLATHPSLADISITLWICHNENCG